MRSATFLLNKHPYAQQAGDTRISRLLIEVAAESVAVRGLALWSGPPVPAPIEVRCVAKPPVRLGRLAARSLAAGRSLVHTRYLTPELIRAAAQEPAECLIAEHTYMSEAALAADRGGDGLLVNTHVLESAVLERRAARSWRWAPLRLEAARTRRDELRCVRAATATVCLGESDLAALRAAGATGVERLDLILAPAERAPIAGPPLALFIGDRGWAPNAGAARALTTAWPRISARVPGAELALVGHPPPRERARPVPGVHRMGFVEDIESVFSAATVLVAPVAIGGGVRVKILEAAARGVPVVATEAAVGSIRDYLPVMPVPQAELIERSAELLGDRDAARTAGEELFEANRELWRSGFVHRGVEAWLERAGRPETARTALRGR